MLHFKWILIFITFFNIKLFNSAHNYIWSFPLNVEMKAHGDLEFTCGEQHDGFNAAVLCWVHM